MKKHLWQLPLWGLVFLLLLLGCRNEENGAATAVPDTSNQNEAPVPDGEPPDQTNPDEPTPSEPAPEPAPLSSKPLPAAVVIDPPTSATNVAATTGGNVQHTVAEGEWLLQIARCYGTSYTAVLQANPQIWNPNYLRPGLDILTIPNVGSTGPVIGAPCVQKYTVQAGDTWQSLAQTYQTTATILQRANPGALSAGRIIFVPTVTSGSVTIPSISRDLLFNYDGDLAVWHSSGNGRVDLYPDSDGYILDLVTNDTGDFVLVRQIAGADQTNEFALIDRRASVQTVLESGLAADQMTEDQPFLTTMLISADGQWGAYLTGTAGSFAVTTFPTASPGDQQSLAIGHGSDELPPRLFAGADNDHFLLMDNSGIYELDYELAVGETQLHEIDANNSATALLFEGVAWSPDGRYLLMQGYYIEGGAYFVLDRETGQIAGLPNSTSYVNVSAAAWLMDGTAVVLSPFDENSQPGPVFASYQPEVISDTLTLSPVTESIDLTLPGGSSEETGFVIASPPVQTAADRYVMAIQMQAGVAGLWALPSGDTMTLNYLNQMPAPFWQLKWLPDSSGLLVDVPGQPDAAGDVVYVSAAGGQPFSLINWLGFKIGDFHWVQPQ